MEGLALAQLTQFVHTRAEQNHLGSAIYGLCLSFLTQGGKYMLGLCEQWGTGKIILVCVHVLDINILVVRHTVSNHKVILGGSSD